MQKRVNMGYILNVHSFLCFLFLFQQDSEMSQDL